jgi:hypothetical protein
LKLFKHKAGGVNELRSSIHCIFGIFYSMNSQKCSKRKQQNKNRSSAIVCMNIKI